MNGLSLALIRRRTDRVSSSKKHLYKSALPVLLSCLIPWTPAITAPLSKDVKYATRSGNRVHIPAEPGRKGREYRGGRYAGDRISLNFQDIEVRAVLQLLADRKIATLVPLHSEFIQINYAKADELTTLLKSKENQLLSERGKVAFDERTNTLLVQDTWARLKDIRRIVRRLDVPVR